MEMIAAFDTNQNVNLQKLTFMTDKDLDIYSDWKNYRNCDVLQFFHFAKAFIDVNDKIAGLAHVLHIRIKK